MKKIIGDYLIKSDSRQLVLMEKDYTIGKVKNNKGETEEVENHKILGYFSDLDVLFRNIGRQIVYDNDDCKVIAEKLGELNNNIKELSDTFKKAIEG